jgi:LPXTG-motif cell wall-anchored protein
LPIEWIIAIIAVVVLLIAGLFLFMRRRSKKA